MPSWELFEDQSSRIRAIGARRPGVKRLSVEAGVTTGWQRYRRRQRRHRPLRRIRPGSKVLDHFGFTVENVVEQALALLGKKDAEEQLIMANPKVQALTSRARASGRTISPARC